MPHNQLRMPILLQYYLFVFIYFISHGTIIIISVVVGHISQVNAQRRVASIQCSQ